MRALACFLAMAVPLRAAPAKWTDGWELTDQYRFDEARETFAHARVTSPEDQRAAHLGEANALLNLQPRTNANLVACVRQLQALVQEKITDDAGVAALYLLARIEEIHRPVPDLPAAVALYTRLAESGSRHPLAQLGTVQLAMLTLYRPLTASLPEERLAAAEAWGKRLTLPSAQGDFHLLLARSYLYFKGSKARAMEHFLEAHRLGITADRVRADACFATAELARETGQDEIAARFYAGFLAENPRDMRAWTARQALAAISSPGSSPAMRAP